MQASTIGADRRGRRARSSSERASPSIRQRPATTFEADPPAITPTFAVVSSSSRPSSIAPIAAAAASIALWPSSGRIPAWASMPSNSADQPLVGRRRGDHLADRARVVEHEAERRPQRAEVELLRAAQPVLLGDREHELEPGRRRALRVARGELDQHRDRRLVVGAEDRLAAAAKDARRPARTSIAPVVRDGVEVGDEAAPSRSRRPGTRAIRFPAPARAGSAASSSDLDAQLAQLGQHASATARSCRSGSAISQRRTKRSSIRWSSLTSALEG